MEGTKKPDFIGARGRRLSLERLYLWIAVPFGLAFALFNPPFHGVPDELAHYLKALALAQGELGSEARAPANYVNLVTALESEQPGRFRVEPAKAWENLRGAPSTEQVEFGTAVGYAYPFGYVPQSVGLWLALRVRAPPLVAFFLGRVLTCVVAAYAVFLAIRVAPFGKRLFLLIGLLPGTLQQMASFSYDSLHVGGLLLFTAYVLALAQETRPLGAAARAKVFALSLAGSLAKPGYALMAMLVFVLPRRLFRAPQAYWWFTGSVVLVNLALLALGPALVHGGATHARSANPAAQLEHVWAHPFAFSEAIGRALLERGVDYWESLVLFSPGSDKFVSPLLYLLAGVGLLLCVYGQDDVVRLSRVQRMVLLGTALVQALSLFLAQYLVSTPVGARIVIGMQGRYFRVLLPLIVLAFQGSGFTLRSEWVRRHPRAALLAFALGVLGWVALELWAQYYGRA